MNFKDISVVMETPVDAILIQALEAEFTLHKLWLVGKGAEVDPSVLAATRGLVTGAASGVNRQRLDELPNLEVIASFGVGLDQIDLEHAASRKIVVASTPNVLDDAVAEMALALLLAVSRRLCEADRFVRRGGWLREKFSLGTTLTDKRCGVVGLGNIGSGIARRAEAFGMTISYHGRHPKPEAPYPYYADLEEMARHCDVLMVVVPGGKETEKLIDRRILEALGPKGILVNVARGSVVDEIALLDALRSGALGAAALDVFENEPSVPEGFLTLPNVLLSPHVATGTVETRRAMTDLTIANLRAHFTGETVPGLVG